MSDQSNGDGQKVEGEVVASQTFTIRCDTFFVPIDESEKEFIEEISGDNHGITGRLGLAVYVDDDPVFIVSNIHYADHSDCGEFGAALRYLQDHIKQEITESFDLLWFEGQMFPFVDNNAIKVWSSAMAKVFKKRVAQRMKDWAARSPLSGDDAQKKIQFAHLYPTLRAQWQYAEIVYKAWQNEASRLRKLNIEPADWKKRILEKYADMPDDLLDQLAGHPDEYSRKPAHLAAAHTARVCGFLGGLSYRRYMRIRQEGEALRSAVESDPPDGTQLEK